MTVEKKTVSLKFMAVIVALSLVAGSAAAVTIVTLSVDSIAPGAGTLSGSSNVDLDSQSLVYEGNNVTAVDVVVNNTDSGSSHTVDVHVALTDSSGTAVVSATNSSVSVAAGSTKTVTVSFSSAPGVDEFQESEVTAEETA